MAGPPVTFAGSMPGDDGANGLIRLAEDIARQVQDGNNPTYLVIGLVDAVTVTGKPRKNRFWRPTLAWRHIEVAVSADDRKRLEELLQEMHGARTSQMQLPYTPGTTVPPTDEFPEGEE